MRSAGAAPTLAPTPCSTSPLNWKNCSNSAPRWVQRSPASLATKSACGRNRRLRQTGVTAGQLAHTFGHNRPFRADAHISCTAADILPAGCFSSTSFEPVGGSQVGARASRSNDFGTSGFRVGGRPCSESRGGRKGNEPQGCVGLPCARRSRKTPLRYRIPLAAAHGAYFERYRSSRLSEDRTPSEFRFAWSQLAQAL